MGIYSLYICLILKKEVNLAETNVRVLIAATVVSALPQLYIYYISMLYIYIYIYSLHICLISRLSAIRVRLLLAVTVLIALSPLLLICL